MLLTFAVAFCVAVSIQHGGQLVFAISLPLSKIKIPIVEMENNDQPNVLSGVAERDKWINITKAPPPMVIHAIGTRLEIHCRAMGGPAPVIRWLRDGTPITELDNYGSNDITYFPGSSLATVDARLVVDNVLPHEKTTYTCLAQAGNRSISASTISYNVRGEFLQPQKFRKNLNEVNDILSKPINPRINMYYSAFLDYFGTTVVLPCRSTGNPKPEIYWKDDMDNLISNATSKFKILRSGELVITGLRWEDMGRYTCVAKNAIGQDNTTTFVYPVRND